MLSKIPRGRFVEVQEISSMIAWMASSKTPSPLVLCFDLSGGRSTCCEVKNEKIWCNWLGDMGSGIALNLIKNGFKVFI